jgi:hypothetical protein
MEVAKILQSWQDGCLADHEAILQIIACPRIPVTEMALQLEAIAIITTSLEGIFKSRLRAQFETFLEERLCVESVGSSVSAQVIAALMAAFDRNEIVWHAGQTEFLFVGKRGD